MSEELKLSDQLAIDRTRLAAERKAEQTREVLQRFTLRAYRRPPTSAEVERLVHLATNAEAAGESGQLLAGLALLLQGAADRDAREEQEDGHENEREVGFEAHGREGTGMFFHE